MGGDKIVLLDGAGANGGGAATNGLLSMIPGMFANLIGGNKMDPNLYPRSEPIFFQYQARCDFNVSGFYFNSYCFILNLINL